MKMGDPIGGLRPGIGGENGVEGEDGAGAAERRELLEKCGSTFGHSSEAVERDEAYSETLMRDFFFVALVLLDDVFHCIEPTGGSKAADNDLVDFGLAAEVAISGEALEVGDELV